MIGRVPREHAAFAAGLASLCGNWHVIAATMAQLGLGVFSAEEVRAAADEWCQEATSRDAVPLDEAIDRTRPGVPA